jgi:hypothetical protein
LSAEIYTLPEIISFVNQIIYVLKHLWDEPENTLLVVRSEYMNMENTFVQPSKGWKIFHSPIGRGLTKLPGVGTFTALAQA